MRNTIILISVLFVSSSVLAQAGAIDSTFGYKGMVQAAPGFRDNYGKHIIVMPDDVIWFSGPSWANAEYNSVGIPKDGPNYASFWPLNANEGSPAMASQADGKVLLGSGRYKILPEWREVPDSTYGINGFIKLPFIIRQIAWRYDGKIFATGSNNTKDFVLTCRNEDGSVDSSFGVNGVVNTDFGGEELTDGLVIQPDGKIVVSGTTYQGGKSNFVIARYLNDGTLDPEFGVGGKRSIVFSEGNSSIASVALHSDGKLVLAGNLSGTTSDLVITTLLPNGETDLAFGTEGKVIVDIDQSDETCEEQSILVDYSDKIVMVGNTAKADVWVKQMLLMRFNSDGTFDQTFAHGGKIQYLGWVAGGVAQQSTGKILVTGSSKGGYGYSVMFVARFNATGGPLPLNVSDFTAVGNESAVLLSWKALSESSHLNFEIERSTNGNTFSKIGQVFQKGNENNFSFEDKRPAIGRNFYRLKKIDLNNTFEYSQTVWIDIKPAMQVKLFPNPVHTIMQVEGLPAGKKQLSIVDYNGRQIKHAQTDAPTFSWNVQFLSGGSYLLVVEGEIGRLTIPFIKK